MIEVTNVKHIEEYKIWLQFNDGTEGVADLCDVLWGEVFEPLKDISKFKNIMISEVSNTIEWENGADLAPEYLYNMLSSNSGN